MSDDSIVVVDDFLDPALYYELGRMVSAEGLQWGARSNSETDPHGHWSRNFTWAGRHNLVDVAPDLPDVESNGVLSRSWEVLKRLHLQNAVLVRCYLNGYTYGTDGYFHTDSDQPGDRTALIYMVDHWEPDWAGETVFLGGNGEIVRAVLPKSNRAVIFPADMHHAARAVSRKCAVLRRALLYKVRARRSTGFERLSALLTQFGAACYQHRRGTLHDHLVRTYTLLAARGYGSAVCAGGGLHSFYGTKHFSTCLATEGADMQIEASFGHHALHLARLFSELERPDTLHAPRVLTEERAVVEDREGGQREVSRSVFDELRAIECANLQDQDRLRRYPALAEFWSRSCRAD
jgi:SM-20-related protein